MITKNNKSVVGERWGRLKILKEERIIKVKNGDRIRNTLVVSVQCDCGEIYEIYYRSLKYHLSTKCKKCSHKAKRKINEGDVFGSLTIKDFVTNRGGRKEAVCICTCGGTKQIRTNLLINGITTHCGCKHIRSWDGVGEISGTFFYRIKRNAEVRGLEFSITKEYIWELFKSQNGLCALSGLELDFSFRTTGLNTASLDRKNNKLGYIPGNVQWVHKDINLMKMDFEELYFKKLCSLIVNKTAGEQ